MSKSSFDINDVKSINAILLDFQVDLILKALMLYKYNLEHVAGTSSKSKREKYITQAEISKLLWFSENCIYKNI